MPHPAMIVPILKPLFPTAHRDLNHTGRAQAILDDAVDGVAVGDVDGGPAVLVAVRFEGFDGTGDDMLVRVVYGVAEGRKGRGRKGDPYPAIKSSRVTPPQFLPSSWSTPGSFMKLRF